MSGPQFLSQDTAHASVTLLAVQSFSFCLKPCLPNVFLLYIHCFPSKAILTLLKYESDPSVSGLSTDVGVFSVCSDYH